MKKIRRILICLIVLSLLCLGGYTYFFSATDLTFSNINVKSNQIPAKFANFKIAYLSDLHIRSQKDITRLKKIVDELNDCTYDMVLFGGDLFESKVISDSTVESLLKKIDSNYGKFAVLGNEDEAHSSEVTQVLNEGGFEVLNDVSRTIYYKSKSITLYGLSPDGDASKIKSDGYTICLAHYPDSFKETAGKVNLQLSGHSGGGFLYLPMIGSLIKTKHALTYNHGTYQKSGSTLIVSNGLSITTAMPYKLSARNEVLMVTLNES